MNERHDIQSSSPQRHRQSGSGDPDFRGVFDAASNGLLIFDLDGRIVEVNRAACRAYGYRRREFLALTGYNLFSADMRGSFDEFVSAIRSEKEFSVHSVHLRKNGTRMNVEIHGALIEFSGIEHLLATVRDTTQRVENARVLKENQRVLTTLMSNLPGMVYRCKNDSDWTMEFVSDGCARLTGYEAADLINSHRLSYSDIIHPDDRTMVWDAIQVSLAKDAPFTIQYRIITAEGKQRWVWEQGRGIFDPDGTLESLEGFITDVTDRVLAEQELATTQGLLTAAVEQSSAGILLADAPDVRIRLANSAALGIRGETPTPLTGIPVSSHMKNWQTFYPDGTPYNPEDLPLSRAILKGEITRGVDVIIRRESGEDRWASANAAPVRNATGKIVAGVVVFADITEQKKAEEELRRSKAVLESLLAAVPVGIGLTRDRILGWCNDRLCTMLNYSAADLEGQSARVLYGSDEEFERVGRVKHADVRRYGIGTIETQFKTRDGRLIDVLLSSAAIDRDDWSAGLVFTAMDITERNRSAAALRESEERFRAVFETAQDAILIKDRNLVYTSVNPSTVKLFGFEGENLIGTTGEVLFGAEAGAEVREVDQRVLRGEIVSSEHTIPVRGEPRTFHVTKVPMRNASGEITALCGIARDVTEIRRLQELASRAERLETAGRIAGQVAHDFNNLLGPLLAYPALIAGELPEDHTAVKYLQGIELAAEQMAEINQQLLTMGRRGHYNQKPLNLNDTVRQVLDRLDRRQESMIIETNLAGDLMNLKGGQSQIHRAIANLVSNAWDAMQGTGRLTITTENFYVDQATCKYGRVPRGEYVKLTVSDTGCGIPSDVLSQIFDPFFTTKSADRKRGSGLGLSVVHAVVKDHNGFIDVESTILDGTSFYLYFPITREEALEEIAEAVVGGTERVLVVDDDDIQRDVTVTLLNTLGYSPTAVRSGEEALETLKEHPFDLIVLDMIMPQGIDGTRTYQEALKIRPGQKAIIVSGFAGTDRVEQALEMGAGAFVRKPLTRKGLALAVRRELDRVAAV